MDRLEPQVLRQLMQHPRGNCVSIFFPTPYTGTAMRENPIWLKNAADEAERRLERHGVRSTVAREIVAPVRALTGQTEFWKHLGHGLALVAAEDLFHTWRLPTPFAPLVHVGPRFHLLPLMSSALDEQQFYVLSVHRHGVHLYRGDRFGLLAVEPTGLPAAATAALHFDERQATVQTHSGNPGLPGKEGRVFHGQGAAADVAKEELTLYFREADAAVRKFLQGSTAPLVYAGLRWQFHLYQEVSRYAALVDQPIADAPGAADLTQLHTEACDVLAPRWGAPLRQAEQRLRAGLGHGLATTDPLEAIRAAQAGAVEALLVAQDAQLPGRYDPQRQAAELCDAERTDAEDLLNLAAILTVQHGGRVFLTSRDQLPDGSVAAALYRYEAILPPVQAGR